MIEEKIRLFQKPNGICIDLTEEEKGHLKLQNNDFVDTYLNSISNEIQSHGLIFRLAKTTDILPIKQFIEKHYPKDQIDEISPYDMYRFIEFGHGVVIESKNNEILGCLFEIGYDTVEKPSYSIRLGVHKKLHGKGLGRLIYLYTCFLAMKRGSSVNKGLIDFDNHRQLYVQINKMGWLFNHFFADLKGMGSCYEYVMPLTKNGLLMNRIDNNKTKEYIINKKVGIDYIINNVDDFDGIARLYEETDFKICAFLRKDIYGTEKHRLLSISSKILKLNIQHHE